MSSRDFQVLHGLHGLRSLGALLGGAVVSIGNFDGVHVGHRALLGRARTVANDVGGRVFAVTFEPHPLTVIRPEAAPARLCSVERKMELLAEAGADGAVILAPTPEVLGLTAARFWEMLRDEARVKHLVEGESFNFGKDRGGNIRTVREWSGRDGVGLTVVGGVEVALLDLTVVAVSSSLVRWLVGNGRMRDAGVCLGRPYALEGAVVRGHQRGRTIGVPTANIDCAGMAVPMDGVYAGRCEAGGIVYPAAVSVGTMPTFGGNMARQVEVHLIGFSGDLYGERIAVEIADWVREQWKFAGVEALKRQLDRDIAVAREIGSRMDTGRHERAAMSARV